MIERLGIGHGKLPASLLKLLRPRSLGQPLILVPTMRAIEQPIEVHFQKALPCDHRGGITQNQQDRASQLPFALNQFGNQSVKNLNGRCFVPVNTCGNDDGLGIRVASASRGNNVQNTHGLAADSGTVGEKGLDFWE